MSLQVKWLCFVSVFQFLGIGSTPRCVCFSCLRIVQYVGRLTRKVFVQCRLGAGCHNMCLAKEFTENVPPRTDVCQKRMCGFDLQQGSSEKI